MSWAALFERAAAIEVTEVQIRDALAGHRRERADEDEP